MIDTYNYLLDPLYTELYAEYRKAGMTPNQAEAVAKEQVKMEKRLKGHAS